MVDAHGTFQETVHAGCLQTSFAGTSVLSASYLQSIWSWESHPWFFTFGKPHIDQCAEYCRHHHYCHFAIYLYDRQAPSCYLFAPPWRNENEDTASWTADEVWYKLPPLNDARIASVKAKGSSASPAHASTQANAESIALRSESVINASFPVQAHVTTNGSIDAAKVPSTLSTMMQPGSLPPRRQALRNESSQVGVKSISSGVYMATAIAQGHLDIFGPSLGYFTSSKEAADACNADAKCWGLTYQRSSGTYQTRTGSDLADAGSGQSPLYVRTIISTTKVSENLNTEDAWFLWQP